VVYLPEEYEAEPGRAVSPGRPPEAIVRKSDATRFLWIDGGEYSMGALRQPSGRPEVDEDQPPHRERVHGFYLQETEVTNGEFEAFLKDGKFDPVDHAPIYADAWEDVSRSRKREEAIRHPAAGIPHRLAAQFAIWVGGRLPLEKEWEFAARSRGKDRPFVWGDDELTQKDLDSGKVNVHARWRDIPTKPVRTSPLDRTEQGILDMAGNVREWCSDLYAPYRPSGGSPPDSHSIGPAPGRPGEHVLRGSSFESAAECALTTHPRRLRASETERNGAKRETWRDIGFRVVIEPIRLVGSPW
jgi:formylglycine-generating enzyme required for sulfatase activity